MGGMAILCYMLYEILPAAPKTRGNTALLVKEGLGAQVYQHLRHDLMVGRYEPGQKLKLRDLAETLGTSVTPVREALARLISDLVLVQIDYRSVCVAVMDLGRFDEVRELRLMLEGSGAERAAECAAPADIDDLKTIHTRLVDARRRDCYPDILLANQQFHLSLCRAARMPVLLGLVEALWVQCGPLMHGMTRWPAVRPKKHPHVAIIEALQVRDGTSARESLQHDIMMSTNALRRYLTSHAERPEWARRSLPVEA